MKRLVISLLLLLGSALSAHEFWLEPQNFHLKKGESLTLKFLVGDDFTGENWKGSRGSVEKLQLYYNEIRDDLVQLLPDSTGGDSLKLQFFDEGTAVIGYQSTNKFINLDAAKFLDYLKEDGLTNAIAYREVHHEIDSSGREKYLRCAKTIFQVGNKMDNSFREVYGFPTEFIPLSNPYVLKKGEILRIKVLVNGDPTAGLLVKTWHRVNGKTEKSELHSDGEGIISIPVTRVGKWMLSNVRMDRIESDSDAEWQSYWATLTWGY